MPTAAKNSGVKILLADDSVTMHRAVTLGLRNEPFEVITCDNGRDALRLALEHKPQVVLADLDMPGLTGIELCHAIRAEASLTGTRVILLCGSFDQIDEVRLNSAKADGRLWKPFESHALLALIQTLLDVPSSKSPTAIRSQEMTTDLAQDMTRETFQQAALAEPVVRHDEKTAPLETPKKQSSKPASRPAESAPIEKRTEKRPEPKAQPIYQPMAEEATSELPNVSVDDASLNLWSTDFDADELSSSFNLSLEDQQNLNTEDFEIVKPEDSVPLEADSQTSEILSDPSLPDPRVPLEEVLEGADENSEPHSIQNTIVERVGQKLGKSKVEAPEVQAKSWSDDSDFSSYRESPLESKNPKARTELTEMQIRSLVREEITEAIRGWLKKDLEAELARVIEEIDRN